MRTKKSPQVVEDEAQVVAGGCEQGVDGIADMAEQVVTVEPAVGLHMADGGLEHASSLEFAFHGGGE